MNQVLACLFPGAFGTLIYSKNKENKAINIVLNYMIITLLTNTICYLFLYHAHGMKKLNFTNIFTLKYILYSSIISVFLGIFITIISKHLNLVVEVKKNERRNKAKNKKNSKNNR